MIIYKSFLVELSRRKDRKGWLTGVSKAIQTDKSLFRLSSRKKFPTLVLLCYGTESSSEGIEA